MVTDKHLEALAQWWSEQLPHVSEGFKLRFKDELFKILKKQQSGIYLTPNSRLITQALLMSSEDNPNGSIVSIRKFMLDFIDTGCYAVVNEDHIIVECSYIPFVSEERLLKEDGTTVAFCIHCLEEVAETVSLCDNCLNGHATCLECRTQIPIPLIGRDGVCEDCTIASVYSVLGELELANENSYDASKEEW